MSDKRLRMPPEIIQFSYRFSVADDTDMSNVFYVLHQNTTGLLGKSPDAWGPDKAEAQAAVVAAAWNDNLASVLSSATHLDAVDWVYNESLETPLLREGTYTGAPLPATGGVEGDALPNGMALSLRFQTGYGGRSRHGRMFLGLIPVSGQYSADLNQISPDYYASVLSAASGWLGQVNNNDIVLDVGDDYSLQVVSFVSGGIPRTPAIYTSVTSANLKDPFLDFQRRRAPAHSRHG